jgi:hypothetical protein
MLFKIDGVLNLNAYNFGYILNGVKLNLVIMVFLGCSESITAITSFSISMGTVISE